MTRIEILEANYWEHFKFAKDISFIYPPNHPKRVKIEVSVNDILTKLNEEKKRNEKIWK